MMLIFRQLLWKKLGAQAILDLTSYGRSWARYQTYLVLNSENGNENDECTVPYSVPGG